MNAKTKDMPRSQEQIRAHYFAVQSEENNRQAAKRPMAIEDREPSPFAALVVAVLLIVAFATLFAVLVSLR